MSYAPLLRKPELGAPAGSLRISQPTDALEQEAERVADRIMAPMAQWSFSAMQPGSASLTPAPAALLQRQPAAKEADPKLLSDFATTFPQAANLIKSSPAAMQLVKEAASAGTAFAGYAEDGPGKDEEGSRPYTRGNNVYIPGKPDPKASHAQTHDGLPAMRDFLFELNNAIRAPKFEEVGKAALKGKKTDEAAARQYAYSNVELEVEGMLRLGEIWFEMKKAKGTAAKDWDQYDEFFFLAEYRAFKDKKKTKDQIVKETLQRKYEGGPLTGKTTEQLYIEHYKEIAGN